MDIGYARDLIEQGRLFISGGVNNSKIRVTEIVLLKSISGCYYDIIIDARATWKEMRNVGFPTGHGKGYFYELVNFNSSDHEAKHIIRHGDGFKHTLAIDTTSFRVRLPELEINKDVAYAKISGMISEKTFHEV